MASLISRWAQSLRSIVLGPFNPKDPAIARLFGGGPTAAGVDVNEWNALTYSAVWAAVGQISSTVASLPLKLYKRTADGGKTAFDGHRLYELLHDNPNSEMTSFIFREMLQAHILTWGNGYAEIERDGAGRPAALWPIPPDRVTPIRDERDRLVYHVRGDLKPGVIIPSANMLHVPGLGYDGLVGYSVIEKARQSLGLGLAAERFGGTFFGNGSTFGGFFTHPHRLSPEARQNIREDLEKHQGPTRAHRILLLQEGMTFQERKGVPPNDAQFLETRTFQLQEVARWFKISPYKLGDLSRATFCLPASAEVYTQEGPRPIADVRVGDSVWSWTGSSWQLSEVQKSGCTGYDEILTLRTTNRTIRLNGRHRVLARRRVLRPVAAGVIGGLSTPDGLQRVDWVNDYVAASELAVGDTLISLSRLPDGGEAVAPNGRRLTVGFMEFAGLLVGDGNVSRQNGKLTGVQIARASHATYMDHYRNVCRQEFRKCDGAPVHVTEEDRQTRFSSAMAATELVELGLGGTARTKRVPGWVYGLTAELRLAFVRGFLDADGSVDKKGRISFSSCNPTLLSGVRHLCMSVGVPVTNMRTQRGVTKLPNGRMANFAQSCFTCSDPRANRSISSHTPEYVRRMEAGRPFDRKGRAYPRFGGKEFDGSAGIELSRIAEISRAVVQEPVYDLTVAGTHSFVADGVVVHNSNIEHQAIEYYTDTIRPWLVRWEQEINRKLIAPLERRQQFAEFVIEGALRGDVQSRYSAYAVGRQWGWLSADDVRSLENMNPLPGGQGRIYLLPQNMVPADRIGEIIDKQIAPPPPPPPPSREPSEEQANSLKRAIDVLESRVPELSAEVDAARAAAAAAREALATSDGASTELRAALAAAEARAAAAVEEQGERVRRAIEHFEARIPELAAELAEAHAQRDEARTALAEVNGGAGEARAAWKAAEARVVELEQARAETVAALALANERKAAIEARAVSAEQLIEALTTERDGLQVSLESAMAGQQRAESERQAAEAARAEAEARVADVQSSAEAAHAERDEARQALAAKQAEVATLGDQIVSLSADIQARERALETQTAADGERVAALSGELAHLRDELRAKLADLEGLTAERDTLNGDLAVSDAALLAAESDLQAARAEAEQATAAVASLEADHRAAVEAAAALEARLVAAEAALAQMETEARAKAEALAAAQAREAEHAAAAGQAREAQAAAEGQVASLDAARAAAIEAVRQAEAEQKAGRGALVSAHRALYQDAMTRLLEREIDRILGARSSANKLRTAMGPFYERHLELVTRDLVPLLRVHLAFLRRSDDPEALAADLAEQHVACSKADLAEVYQADADEFPTQLSQMIQRWRSRRTSDLAEYLMRREIEHG